MKHKAWWIAGAVVLVGALALGLWGVQRARTFEGLARSGKADAVAGLRSLQAKEAATALTSFQQARDEFGRARELLGPEWLRGLPWLGRQLSVADDLAAIGFEGSAAGAEASQLLVSASSATGDDRVGQMLTLSQPHMDAALVSLVAVAQRSQGLTTDGLVPQLAGAVTALQEQLEPLRLVLQRSESLLSLERYLFSAQHRFLLVSQNSAELRPAGGFMGTYGLVEFGPDGLRLTKFTDIYTLPADTLKIPMPLRGPLGYKHFAFRDSNWWVDFPTSARVMTQFWQNLKQPEVDGIIAIDIPTIRDLLAIFGPIKVPESKEPLTAKNVMEQLTYVVEFENAGAGADKKKAVVSLAAELLRRVTHLSNDQFLPTVEALATSASEKHLQLFFADAAAQQAVVEVGWSGAIAPPADTTDLLAVSNGVIKASKANIGVSKTIDYRVDLKGDGTASTSLSLGYKKSSLKLLGVPRQWMGDYVRIHRGAGATMVARKATTFEALSDATGLPTFGHYFVLDRGASTGLVFRSDVPQAVRQGRAASLPGGPSDTAATGEPWHYRLLVVKQADLVDTTTALQVTAPDGWKVIGSAAWFRVSGATVPVAVEGGTVVNLKSPLKQDLLLDVTLAKA